MQHIFINVILISYQVPADEEEKTSDKKTDESKEDKPEEGKKEDKDDKKDETTSKKLNETEGQNKTDSEQKVNHVTVISFGIFFLSCLHLISLVHVDVTENILGRQNKEF